MVWVCHTRIFLQIYSSLSLTCSEGCSLPLRLTLEPLAKLTILHVSGHCQLIWADHSLLGEYQKMSERLKGTSVWKDVKISSCLYNVWMKNKTSNEDIKGLGIGWEDTDPVYYSSSFHINHFLSLLKEIKCQIIDYCVPVVDVRACVWALISEADFRVLKRAS